jgi:hypothetical protein
MIAVPSFFADTPARALPPGPTPYPELLRGALDQRRGVYDVTADNGTVSVGITSDTAGFAVQSISCRLERMDVSAIPMHGN